MVWSTLKRAAPRAGRPYAARDAQDGVVRIPLSFEDHERIPRHPDWRWEYWDGAAQISYRPRPICVRRWNGLPVVRRGRHDVRLVHGADDLARAFLAEFWRAEDPCRTFEQETAIEWLRACLDDSFARLAEPAGAVADVSGQVVGVVLLERPHRNEAAPFLSWLSVRPGYRCDGVGTALLAAIVDALNAGGVQWLDSGASPANRASLVWHWRNGFQALPDPGARFGPHARRS